MKKTYYTFACTLLFVINLACKKRDQSEPETNKQSCQDQFEILIGNQVSDRLTVTLDGDGRVSRYQSTDYDFNYQWNANGFDISLAGNKVYEVTLNGGKIVKFAQLRTANYQTFAYNANGQLTRMDDYVAGNLQSIYTYEYANGDLIKMVQTHPQYPETKRQTTYTYQSEVADQRLNQALGVIHGDLGTLIPMQYFGTGNRHVLSGKTYTYDQNASHSDYISTYTYTKNGDTYTGIKIDELTTHYNNGVQHSQSRYSQAVGFTFGCP